MKIEDKYGLVLPETEHVNSEQKESVCSNQSVWELPGV